MKHKSNFRDVHFFHGLGGSPEGSVALLEKILRHGFPDICYHRPLLPHSKIKKSEDPVEGNLTWFGKDLAPAEETLAWLENQYLPFIAPGSLIVGISMGGLVAAKLQELHPELDLSVFSIVAPTNADVVKLERKIPNRVALFSSADQVVKDRCNWSEFSDLAFDVPWLMHDVDPAKYTLCYLISCYLRGLDMTHEVETLFPEPPAEDLNEQYIDKD